MSTDSHGLTRAEIYATRPQCGRVPAVREVFRAETGGHAAWEEFRVYQHPREELLYTTSSQTGCSCYWFEEPTYAELEATTPLSSAGVRRALGDHLRNSRYTIEASAETGLIDRLNRQLREATGR